VLGLLDHHLKKIQEKKFRDNVSQGSFNLGTRSFRTIIREKGDGGRGTRERELEKGDRRRGMGERKTGSG
jgi:hypothetical protein